MFSLRKTLLMLICMTVTITLSAEPITREQARLRALAFLQKAPGSRQLSPVVNRARLSPRHIAGKGSTAQELYYVFNRGDNQGYVIATGDDKLRPVIGYTDQGQFDYNTLPDNMRFWLQGYEAELQYLSEHPELLAQAPRYAPIHKAIAPMVTTRWNQTWPYNNECPQYFNLGRSVTGCVATAMAQILYYQHAKSVTETQAEMPSYATATAHPDYGKLNVEGIPSGSPIDWDNMLDTYSSTATAKQQLAVAQLMHYCGVSVKMDYSNSSSGAFSYMVAKAMTQYFGYGSSVKYVYKDDAYTDDEWDALLYKELAEGRPFYLSGANSSGGHAFVCDGYDDQGCYHINWGWGGSSDGYYLLTRLNPGSQGVGGSSGGYSQQAEAVIGCEPENYMSRAMPISNATVKKICIEKWDTDLDGQFSFGEAAAVTDIGTAFQGKTAITTFDELYYFTGLTWLANEAFMGCTALKEIRLPKNLQSIGKRTFQGCTRLKTVNLPEGLTYIGEAAFSGCRLLPNVTLPQGITRIEDNTFNSCQAFTELRLSQSISYIGTQSFQGCTKLATVYLGSVTPQTITLGQDVFDGITLADATLYTPQGNASYLAAAPQWKDFGTIREQRTLSAGTYASLAANTPYYVYNLGMGRYLTRGEAYGTQAVVDDTDSPMRFELRRTSSMASGTYYLYSDDTGNSKHILFRCDTDSKIGLGINACFVDGATTDQAKGYWTISPVAGSDKVYTMQIPVGQTGYQAGRYLGVCTTHASNAASPTYGIYSDIDYSQYPLNCQWMLVPYDQAQTTNYQTAVALGKLLDAGVAQKIDVAYEQAIYDNMQSTTDDLLKGCRKMRTKLGLINFADPVVRSIVINNYDADNDGEISISEVAAVSEIKTIFYGNSKITDLADLARFTGIDELPAQSFRGCTSVLNATLPDQLKTISRQAFYGCTKLQSVTLGSRITSIGDNAFDNANAITQVRIYVPDPTTVKMGSNVFSTATLAGATLYVPYGSRQLYEQADVWKDFGTIAEMRAPAVVPYATEPQEQTDYYIYNLGLKNYITKGEAYGTQAIVGSSPMVYQLRRTGTMPAGTYYLYSEETGDGSNKVLKRVSNDKKVGDGVKTCFVDGTVTSASYWTLAPVPGQPGIFTLQVPVTDSGYTAGEYLGTDLGHVSQFTEYTYGLYWDVSYDGNPANCQWGFVSADQVRAVRAFYDKTQHLRQLIQRALDKSIDVTAEQSVYDNFQSTEPEIDQAVSSLRRKLRYIDFADPVAAGISISRWDDDEDGELSLDEAAAITTLGSTFRSATKMQSLDELQYFTSLTTIGDEAFRNCPALTSIYIPQNVTTIGQKTFYSSSGIRYVAILAPQVVEAASSSLNMSKLTLFIPQPYIESYAADPVWGAATITPYTGIPVVSTDPLERLYGRTNPAYTYDVTGAPVNGTPTFTCAATSKSPVGTYPIQIAPGNITTPGVQLHDGTLQVTPAPLTLTAKSYTRQYGEENPQFQFTNTALRNSEKINDILLRQPDLQCDATPDSPAGEYEIRISGAETQNYQITYVNGTLTIENPTGVTDVRSDDVDNQYYDLQGRRVSHPVRGLYIVNGRKVMVR